MSRIFRLIILSLIVPLILSAQMLVRPTGFNLHHFEQRSIKEGEVDPYLANRLSYEWRSGMPFGSDDLLRSEHGESWLRKDRIKVFPALTTTFYANGGKIKREGPVADISPTVNLFAGYRLPPLGRYGLILWTRIEEHAVVSQKKISELSYDLSWQKEIGKRVYPVKKWPLIEYRIGDGGILLSHPRGEVFFAKSNPVWGAGYTGQLLLSNWAPSFVFAGFRHRITEKLTFSFLHGNLNSTFLDSTRLELYPDTTGMPTVRKYITGHRLDFAPLDGVLISVGETVIYGARGVEMAYALPVLFYWAIEPDLGDSDNLQMFGEIQYVRKDVGRFYASVYIDEWDFVDTFNRGKSRNWMAYQLGFNSLFPFPKKWNSLFRAEFTHLTPYVYVHRSRINLFQHYGHELGFWSGPNSDNIFLSVEGSPREGLWVQLYGQRTRRGEISEETIAKQYDFERIPFLSPYESNPETRFLLGLRGELLLSPFTRLSFDIYYDLWLRRGEERVDSRKFDGMLRLSVGL